MSEILKKMEDSHTYPGIRNAEDGGLVQKQTTVPLLLGPEQCQVTCPLCHAVVTTRVNYVTTTRTHITAALSFWICCCCCIPYCCSSAKNTDHYCPNCRRYLGTYKK